MRYGNIVVMKMILKISLIVFFFAGLITACEEIRSYPDIPTVDYKPPFSFYLTTDALGNRIILGKLSFDFTDGDGDLGLEQSSDTGLPDSLIYNLFLSIYEKNDTGFAKVEDVNNLNFRIPYIEREGQNKTLTGNITVDLEYKTFEYDTIFYTFYIVDRQLNKSNIDSTEILIFTGLKDSLENIPGIF